MGLSSLAGWGGMPVVIALVEAVKVTLPGLDKRWLPGIAVVLGMAWCLALAAILGLEYGPEAVKGVLVGLGAVGLFSGLRATSGR